MGERQLFQPLTKEDRITVLLYRSGIVLSAVIVVVLAFLLRSAAGTAVEPVERRPTDLLMAGLYATTGLSVFFIHLYVGAFKRYLKNLYYIGLGCLALLLVLGKGSPSAALAEAPVRAVLLLPLAGCLGFVTAKEAFCFRLLEGYILAMLMPIYLLLVAGNFLSPRSASAGLLLIASLLVLFTLRKVFMPLAYDIGDKTAYR